MKQQASRYGSIARYKGNFPVCGRSTRINDYPVLFRQTQQLAYATKNYLFLNRGWYRTRGVYSHSTVIWINRQWVANVFFVGSPRRSKNIIPRLKRFVNRRSKRTKKWNRRPTFVPGTAAQKRQQLKKRNSKQRRRYLRNRRFSRGRIKRKKPLHYRGLLRRKVINYLRNSYGSKLFYQYPTQTIPMWNRFVWALRSRWLFGVTQQARLWGLEKQKQFGGPVQWRWCYLRGPHHYGVTTVMAYIRYKLRGRSSRSPRSVSTPILRLTRKLPGVSGAQIRCAGRFTRKPRADYKVFRWGRLNKSSRATPVEEAFMVIPLKFGTIGLSLTVSFEQE